MHYNQNYPYQSENYGIYNNQHQHPNHRNQPNNDSKHSKTIAIVSGIIVACILGLVIIGGVVTVIVLGSLGIFKKSSSNNVQNTNIFNASNSCGRSQISPSINGLTLNGRIINGQNAVPNSWPWMVSLRLVSGGNKQINSHFCGGVLIDLQYVLTAAHCLRYLSSGGYGLAVIVGINNIKSYNKSNVYYASNYSIHSQYSTSTLKNDIGLVKLSQPVNTSANVSTICLPSSPADGSDVFFKDVVMTGWGLTNYLEYIIAQDLQQTVLQVLGDDSRCYTSSYYDSSTMYCALARDGSTDTCNGDSGGPVMYFKDDAWYTYGITSFGSIKCNVYPSSASYYTKVPNYLEWIRDTMSIL